MDVFAFGGTQRETAAEPLPQGIIDNLTNPGLINPSSGMLGDVRGVIYPAITWRDKSMTGVRMA